MIKNNPQGLASAANHGQQKMSVILARNPSFYDTDKLSMVGVDLNHIDPLPARISKTVKTLYLSNNYLDSLEHIDQFENLLYCSLTHNFIRYLDQIQPLSRLKSLLKVSLSGNIVTKMPYYKEHMLSICPSITSLDGVKVTPVDRSKAKLVFFKARSFYDQLRLNEFRNNVLVHISKLLACHLEIREEVIGKFRTLLSSHVTTCAPLRVGAGKILQQALRGGVYRWLQQMCSKHFNHLVQDNLYKILIKQHKRSSNAREMDSTNVWDSLVAEYLKDQQEYFLDLTEYCAALSSKLNTGHSDSSEHQQALNEALDNEVLMDGMGQLQFLSSSMDSHRPLGSDEERISCGVGGIRPIVDSMKSNGGAHADASSRFKARHVSHGKENMLVATREGNEGVIQQSSAERNHPLADSRLAAAVHSEAVHQKYVQLLQQMERPPVDSRPALPKATAPSKPRNLSSMLPPQQVEPEKADVNDLLHDDITQLQDCAAAAATTNSLSPTVQRSRSDVGTLQSAYGFSEAGGEQPTDYRSTNERVGQGNHRSFEDALVSRNDLIISNDYRRGKKELLGGDIDDRVVLDSEDDPSSRMDSRFVDHIIEQRDTTTRQTITTYNSDRSRMNDLRQDADGKVKGGIKNDTGDDEVDRRHLSSFHSDGQRESVPTDDKVLPIDMDQIIQRACTTRGDALSEDHMHIVNAACDHFRAVSEDIESSIQSHKWKEAMADQCMEQQDRCSDRSADLSTSLPPTMATLKASIQHLSNRFMLLQREEHSIFEFRDRIVAAAETFQNQSISAADGALVAMLRDRNEIAECRNDIKYASLWLELHGHFEEIETLKGAICDVQRHQQQLSSSLDRVVTALHHQSSVQLRLGRSLAEVEVALASCLGDLDRNPAVRSLMRDRKLSELLEKSSGSREASLKRRVFKLFRSRVRRQVDISIFFHRTLGGRRRSLLSRCVGAWVRYLAVARRGRRLQRIHDVRTKRSFLSAWSSTFEIFHQLLPTLMRRTASLRLTRAFRHLLELSRASALQRNVSKRNDLYVTIFRGIRIFREWRALTNRGLCDSCTKASHLRLSQQLRVMSIWKDAAHSKRLSRVKLSSIIEDMVNLSSLKRHWVDWLTLCRFKIQLGDHRQKRRYFLQFRSRVLSQRPSRRHASYHMKRSLEKAILQWRMMSRDGRHNEVLIAEVRRKWLRRCLLYGWTSWRSRSQKLVELRTKCSTASLYVDINLQQRHFNRWRRALLQEIVINKIKSYRPVTLVDIKADKDISSQQDSTADIPFVDKKVLNRLRSSMTVVDFELLYLDDDSELEGNSSSSDRSDAASSNSAVKASSVFAWRYFQRWSMRSTRLKDLHTCSVSVQLLVRGNQQRTYFSRMSAAWTSAMMVSYRRYLDYLKQRSSSVDESKEFNLEASSTRLVALNMEYASNVQRRSDLLHSMDESTLVLTAIRQSSCSQDTVLSDLQVSEGVLTSEYALLVGELGQANAYIEQLKSIHEQLISCQVDATRLYDPVQHPLDQKSSSSSNSSSSSSASIPCDDRMHLMRDVETLYKRAVNSQESMLTRKQRLIENIGSTYSRNAQWKQDSDRLDHEIERVRGQRDQLELSFSTCNVALDEACRNVQLKTNQLEDLLGHLEVEENELNEVLQKYCSQELLLREELEAIQAEFNGTAPVSSARALPGPATWGRQQVTVETTASPAKDIERVSMRPSLESPGEFDNSSSERSLTPYLPPSVAPSTSSTAREIEKQIDELSQKIRHRFTEQS